MWLRDTRLTRRSLLLGAGTAALLLSACGFHPVHGDGAGGDAIDGIVAIETPDGRNGFALREALERRLGRAAPGAPWTLAVTLSLSQSGLAIAENSAITRYVLRGGSDWALKNADGEVALKGRVESMSAYSATGSLYATRTARRAAQRRVAEDLGERIATRLAAALADGRGAAAGVVPAPGG